MKGTWRIFRLLLVAKTLPQVCAQHRDKVAVAAGPHKTEPGPKPLRCWSPSFQAFKASLFLAFSRHASWPPGEVGFPGACLEYRKGFTWALQSWIPILGLHLFQSETTQLSVQVTGVGGE